MGNSINAPSQGKPLLVGGVPDNAKGPYKVTFSAEDDRETVNLAVGNSPNGYYLPWKNKDYTEGTFSLLPKATKYFFTADMSGCSLWYQLSDNKLTVRHEARTDGDSQRVHSSAGFKLVFDTNTDSDVTFTADENGRTAVYYAIYALVDYTDQQIEFRIQKVKNVKNFKTKKETYSLVSQTVKTVLFVYV